MDASPAQTPRPDATLPDDWPEVGVGERTRETALAAGRRFLVERQSSLLFAFAAGSFSRSQQTGLSDLDLYVVEAGAPPMLREQLVVDDICLQIGSLSLPDAYGLIQSGQRNANPFFVAGAAESIFVEGDRDRYDAFLAFAKQAMESGPAQAPTWRLARKRLALVNAYMKCRKASLPSERLGAGVRFLDLLSDYWQMRQGLWVFERAWAVRKAQFPRQLDEDLSRLICEGQTDSSAFTARAAAALREVGAFSWTTSACGPLPLSAG